MIFPTNMKITQEQWLKNQLLENGKVTRNQALRVFFSRLGARIKDLRDAGWEIEGHFKKSKRGTDYEYTLIKNVKN